MKNKNNYIKLVSILCFILYSIVLYFFTYIIKYDQLANSVDIFTYLVKVKEIQYIVVSYLIILSILVINKSIFRDTLISNIISTIQVLIITLISYYKFKTVNLPFLPNDVLLIGNLNQIATFGLSIPSIQIIAIIILLILLLVLHYLYRKPFYEKKPLSIKNDWYRIPLFITGMSLLFVLCISPNRFNKIGLKNDLGDNYSWMGGNGVFFLHLGELYLKQPKDYSKENIQKIKEKVQNDSEIASDIDNPNIILIMCEAFSDPNKIKNVKYSINPMGNIENLAKTDSNCIMGNIVSPVVGGGTSLPEFEVLTGLSSYYIEKQIFPYTSYIRGDMNSITRILNDNNYDTVGLHTNTQTFYNRKNIYKYFGFKQTVFSEDIKNPEMKVKYISDNEFSEQIIKKFNQTENKKFIFGVTMQNHMPYNKSIYDSYDIQVQSDDLNDNEKNDLTNYLQGVYDDDKMYIKLVDYLKKSKEPTILIMFGDHLPALSRYSIYEKSEYDKLDYFTTPYVIWANYNIDYTNLPNYMSTNYFAINILKLANVELPWYLKKFEELYKEYPVINNRIIISREGKMVKSSEIANNDIVKECEILQYDLLMKKKYIDIIK